MTDIDFVGWLTAELSSRGWSNSELARRAGVVPSTISMVISRKNQPTWELCAGVSTAFDLPAEDVFRRAGLLPPIPSPHDVRYITEAARSLDPENVKSLREFADYLLYKKNKPQTK